MAFRTLASLMLLAASSLAEAEFQTNVSHHNPTVDSKKLEVKKTHGWSADIAMWKPPQFLSRECPYYHAGYDYEGKPVMIAEYGKWNTRKYMEAGNETFLLFEKYIEKFFWRTALLEPVDPEAEDGILLLFDMAGFDNSQLTSPVLIAMTLKFAHFTSLIEHRVADFLVINASHAVIIFQNLMQSVSGRLIGRMEKYGNKPEVWKRQLLNKIPPDQLPPWYGGKKSFKPVQVFV